jgi:hypothetical protein
MTVLIAFYQNPFSRGGTRSFKPRTVSQHPDQFQEKNWIGDLTVDNSAFSVNFEYESFGKDWS